MPAFTKGQQLFEKHEANMDAVMHNLPSGLSSVYLVPIFQPVFEGMSYLK
jgi:hypothetical protein